MLSTLLVPISAAYTTSWTFDIPIPQVAPVYKGKLRYSRRSFAPAHLLCQLLERLSSIVLQRRLWGCHRQEHRELEGPYCSLAFFAFAFFWALWSAFDVSRAGAQQERFPDCLQRQGLCRPSAPVSHVRSPCVSSQFYADVLKSGALSRLAFFNIDM